MVEPPSVLAWKVILADEGGVNSDLGGRAAVDCANALDRCGGARVPHPTVEGRAFKGADVHINRPNEDLTIYLFIPLISSHDLAFRAIGLSGQLCLFRQASLVEARPGSRAVHFGRCDDLAG